MTAKTLAAAPYAGLRAYSEDDAPFFFGRKKVAQILTDNLRAKRLTLVYGASGVGKSSVLRAGVQYQLHRSAQKNSERSGSPRFAVAVFHEWLEWKDDPISGLRHSVQDAVRRVLADPAVEMAPSSASLAESFQGLARQVGGDLLIILDQFEDYFLASGQAKGEGTFAYEFQRLVNRPDLRVNFLLSIREDAYSKLEIFKDDISGIYDNSLQIDHLDIEAAREAIIGPIDQYNRFYAAGDEQIAIEPALVEEVLIQVRTGHLSMAETVHSSIAEKSGGAGTEPTIETPFLQLVMTALWKAEMSKGSTTLRLQTLQDLEGARKIVGTHLRQALEKLSESEKALAASAFGDLVTPSGDKRSYTAFDIAEAAELNREQLTALLDKLSRGNNRILRSFASPDRKGESSYEIFHDVLAEPILDWRRQYRHNQKLKEEKRKADEELSETKRRAEEEKKLAEARARADEQTKIAAILRLKNRALVLATAAAVILAFIAAWQYMRAERARHQAVVAGNAHSEVLAGLYPLIFQSNDQDQLDDQDVQAAQRKAIHQLEATSIKLNEFLENYQQDAGDSIGEGITRNNIAGLYRLTGNSYAGLQDYANAQALYQRAEENYREALALLEDVHAVGPDHPDVATSLSDLAILYSDRGEYAKAEPLFKSALTIFENALGSDDRFVADAVVRLAHCYYFQGKYDDAEDLYKRALKIRQTKLRADHPEVAESLNHLAWLYFKRGKFAQAEPLFKESLDIWERQSGLQRSYVALSLNGLAALSRERGEYAESAEYLKKAVEARKDLLLQPQNGLDYAEAIENWALFYNATNDSRAESSFLDALERRRKGLGDAHPDTGYTEGKLASLYYKQGRYLEAAQYFNQALKSQQDLPSSPDLAQTLYGLARLYGDQGKYDEAEPRFKQALAIQEKAIPEHPDFADTLDGYAGLLDKTDRPAAAAQARSRAERVRQIHRKEYSGAQ